jgi:hypothetical protein
MLTRSGHVLFALLAVTTAGLTIGACNNQSEGGVCQSSSDCESNLECTQLPNFGLRCCPILPAQPTTQVCSPNQANLSDANAPPADANTIPTPPSTDASPDGPESAAEGAVDAPSEAEGSAADAADAASSSDAAADSPDGAPE